MPLYTWSENNTVKTWNLTSHAMLAAIAVYREAYARHPIHADTSETFDKACAAARKFGASYGDASNLAVVAWDQFSKSLNRKG